MAYEAQPGSVAYRAIAFLETQQAGAKIAGASLAAHINTEPSNLSANLAHAKLNGGVFSRQKGGHPKSPMFWSLTDHSDPTTKTASELAVPRFQGWSGLATPLMPGVTAITEYTEARDSQQVLKAEPETADATDRETPVIASPSVGSMGADQASDDAVTVASDKSFWLGSDGALHIGRPLGGVELSPAETGALYGFLHRCREVLA